MHYWIWIAMKKCADAPLRRLIAQTVSHSLSSTAASVSCFFLGINLQLRKFLGTKKSGF